MYVVAACKNRHAQLRMALDSWLAAQGVSQVVLVDWDSTPAYTSTLPPYILDNPLLKVVRVAEQPHFKLTWAYNLAATFVPRGSAMLKVDCDTIVARDFLNEHPLHDGVFYAGDYRSATTDNDAHLNGVFHARAEDFQRVGGYDERIQSYGWDDSDLYRRWNALGLMSRPLQYGSAHHMHHGDHDRMQLVAASSPCPHYELALNRLLSGLLPPWNTAMPRAQYSLALADAARPGAVVKAGTGSPSLPLLVGAADLENSMKRAGLLSARLVDGFRMDSILAEVPPTYLANLVTSYYLASKFAPSKTMLTVHLQHGLGNRLRVLASAVALSKRSRRWLRVICEKDRHFDAQLADVLDLQASGLLDVWTEFDYRELSNLMVETYDYMDPAVKGTHIAESSLKHVYVRSAYRLNSSTASAAEQDAELRALVPSSRVLAIAASVDLPRNATVVGVHVRHVDPRGELPGMSSDEYPEADWPELIRSRNASNLAAFAAEMSARRRSHNTVEFFLAADHPALLSKLGTHGHVHFIERGSCANRSATCLQYAMADLVVLGRTQQIMGSPTSSFTEAAACLAGVDPAVAGIHF